MSQLLPLLYSKNFDIFDGVDFHISHKNISILVVDTLLFTQKTVDFFTVFLSEGEKNRLKKLACDVIKQRFIVSRILLRYIYTRISGENYVGQKIYDFNLHGKPHFIDFDITFNISYSGSLVVLALGVSDNIGIDIEEIKGKERYATHIIKKSSLLESEQLISLPKKIRPDYFCGWWVCKEAFLKAKGESLLMMFDKYPLLIPIDTNCKNLFFNNYYINTINISESYKCALVSERPYLNITVHKHPRLSAVLTN